MTNSKYRAGKHDGKFNYRNNKILAGYGGKKKFYFKNVRQRVRQCVLANKFPASFFHRKIRLKQDSHQFNFRSNYLAILEL